MSQGVVRKANEARIDRLRVFISYSRKDAVAADALVGALIEHGFDVKIDTRDLPFGEEWQRELAEFIRLSDTVIWLVSEASIGSEWVNWELDEVKARNKRLVPIMFGIVDPSKLPRQLGAIQILPRDRVFDLARDLDTLVAVLETDHAWLKQATRWQDRATEWLAKERASGLLLSRAVLAEAERWKDARPSKAPAPAPEVLDLMLASRQAATQRQRWWTGGVSTALVLALGLAGFAWWQREEAVSQEKIAVEQRTEAEKQEKTATEQRLEAEKQRNEAARQRDTAEQQRQLAQANELRAVRESEEAARQRKLAEEREAQAVAARKAEEAAKQDEEKQRRAAEKSEASARASLRQAQVNIALFRAAQAEALIDAGNPTKAALLALDSLPVAESTIVAERDLPEVPEILLALNRASKRAVRDTVLRGHRESVTNLRFSRSARFLHSNDFTKGARLWDLSSETAIISAETKARVWDGALSPDEKRWIITDEGGDVRMFDVESRREVVSLKPRPFGHFVSTMGDPSNWSVVLVSNDGTLEMREPDLNRVRFSIKAHKDWILHHQIDERRRRIITMGRDGFVRIWDVANRGKLIYEQRIGDVWIGGLRLSADANRLVAWNSRNIFHWSFDKHAPIYFSSDRMTAEDDIVSVQFGRSSQVVVVRDRTGALKLWDLDYAKTVAALKIQGEGGFAAVFGDDNLLLTAETQGSLSLWRMDSQTRVPIGAANAQASAMAVSSDGNLFAIGDRGGFIQVFSLSSRAGSGASGHRSTPKPRLTHNEAEHTATLLGGPGGGSVKLQRFDVLIPAEPLRLTLLSATADRVLVGNNQNTVFVLWDGRTGQPVAKLDGLDNFSVDVKFSADGNWIAAIDGIGNVVVWNARDGTRIIMRKAGETGSSIAFTPDGKALIHSGDRLQLLDRDSLKVLRQLPPHSAKDRGRFSLSAEGLCYVSWHSSRFSTADDGRRARVWSTANGSQVADLIGHQQPIAAADINSDCTLVATAGTDRQIKVWDVKSGRALWAAQGPQFPESVQFSGPDTITVDGQDHVFRSRPDEVAAISRSSVSRCLTRSEREELKLAPQPPSWCITMRKPPYDSQDWRDWLAAVVSGQSTLMPKTD